MIQRRAVGLLTSFQVHEFGMSTFEPLAWASATLSPASPKFPRSFHILANGHVVTPWRYLPLYAPDQVEWLQHVRQHHCRYEIQVVNESGDVVASVPLASTDPFVHERRDVVAMYLRDEEDVERLVDEVEVVPSQLATRDPVEGDVLELTGHSLDDLDDERRVLRPILIEGRLKLRTDMQTFLETATTLPQGMCGAPALFKDDSTCAGIVDGIVSPKVTPDEPDLKRTVAGAASIISASELAPFLRRAEASESLLAALAQPNDAASHDSPSPVEPRAAPPASLR